MANQISSWILTGSDQFQAVLSGTSRILSGTGRILSGTDQNWSEPVGIQLVPLGTARYLWGTEKYWAQDGVGRQDETGEQDNDIRVVEYEALVEVGEAKEGLNVPNFPWLRPILYGLDLRLVYGGSLGRENVSEVFNSFRMEFALVSAGE